MTTFSDDTPYLSTEEWLVLWTLQDRPLALPWLLFINVPAAAFDYNVHKWFSWQTPDPAVSWLLRQSWTSRGHGGSLYHIQDPYFFLDKREESGRLVAIMSSENLSRVLAAGRRARVNDEAWEHELGYISGKGGRRCSTRATSGGSW